jgi:hypothetical protein
VGTEIKLFEYGMGRPGRQLPFVIKWLNGNFKLIKINTAKGYKFFEGNSCY